MINNFSKIIIDWYKENKRDLPWRNTKNPYKIWLSEIILQQTQVKQGLPYYEKFIDKFPTLKDLANAHEDTVLKLWQGLGYYSRARNLLFAAKYIYNDLDGVFPNTYKALLKLKGVGDYTAAAIASFAYHEQVPVIDGNVYRVLSRVYGEDTPINTTPGIKIFKNLALKVFNNKQPATYNQAIMEFGALMCKPKSPDCLSCPLQTQCVAFQQNKINSLPVKLKKIKHKKRYFNYLVVRNDDSELLIEQRQEQDIWQKLYQFPLIETENIEHDIMKKDVINLLQIEADSIEKINKKPYKHVLTHVDIYANFWLINTNYQLHNANKNNYEIIKIKNLKKYAIPRLVDKFVNEYLI